MTELAQQAAERVFAVLVDERCDYCQKEVADIIRAAYAEREQKLKDFSGYLEDVAVALHMECEHPSKLGQAVMTIVAKSQEREQSIARLVKAARSVQVWIKAYPNKATIVQGLKDEFEEALRAVEEGK